jgi:vitamin B12 transporter
VTNPSFFELYGFAPSNFIGNPNLVPESSIGWDAGIEQTLFDQRFIVDVTYFQSRLRNEIQTIFVPPGSFTAINLPGISNRNGVEITGKLSPTPWLLLSAGYTYTDSRDFTETPELRRPRHAATGSATVKFANDRGKATVNVVYNGEMRDTWFKTPAETVFLRAYTLVGGQISYDVTPWATAYVRAENLFDTQYEEVFSYRSPGFAAYAGLRFKTPE